MTADEAKQIIAVIESSWRGPPLNAIAVSMWGAALMDHKADAVMRVVSGLVRTSKWRPSLAEILEPLLADPDRKSASAAFETVWGQIGQRPRQVSELEAKAVQRLGGWTQLGGWQINDRHWHAKRFADVYDELTEDARGEALRALTTGPRALDEAR